VTHVAEVDAEELGSPLGVVVAQVQSGIVDGLLTGRLRTRAGVVAGSERGLAARAEALDQGSGGARVEVEVAGNLRDGLTVLPPPEESQADGDGDGTRHGSTPVRWWIGIDEHQHKKSRTPRQNLMSQLPAKLPVA
jgi:hypothetical protein